MSLLAVGRAAVRWARRLALAGGHAIMGLNALVVTALLALITVQMVSLAAEYYAIGRTTITMRIARRPLHRPLKPPPPSPQCAS